MSVHRAAMVVATSVSTQQVPTSVRVLVDTDLISTIAHVEVNIYSDVSHILLIHSLVHILST